MSQQQHERTRPAEPVEAVSAAAKLVSGLPGLGLATAVALGATLLGRVLPLAGAPVLAVAGGVALSGLLGRRTLFRPGLGYAATRVLQLSVVVLGTQLSLQQAARVGLGSLPVMLGTLVACLLAALVAGRLLRIEGTLAALIGVGTAICGASAIAALAPVVKARQHVVSYAVSTIFAFNIAAVLIFPPLGHTLGLSQAGFGLFAGTAVNDTSSVLATATSYGATAANHAVVVKLVRTLTIIPVSLAAALLVRRSERRHSPVPDGDAPAGGRTLPHLPWFLLGFVAVVAVNSIGVVPVPHAAARDVAGFLIATALASIGLSTDVAGMRRAGVRPLLLGAILWGVVSTSSLLLQAAT